MSRRGEAGAASLLVVAMIGVLLIVGAALGVVAAMVVAHRQAQSAADLAALAAARTLVTGGDPCAAAHQVASANGAGLHGCLVSGEIVTVDVTVTGPHWLGQAGDLSGRARAGPVEAAP